MSKRFTETLKWRDPWFRKLSPEAKLLWFHVVDHCDGVGVIDLDLEAASFDAGIEITKNHLKELSSRLIHVGDGKYFIEKFIQFQYGKLSEDCKAHKPLYALIEKYRMSRREGSSIAYAYPINNLPMGLPEPVQETSSTSSVSSESSVADELDEQALTVYSAYPRKISKPPALRAIKKAIKIVGFEKLLSLTKQYSQLSLGTEIQFIPHPATWFNEERFNDDPETWKPKNKNQPVIPFPEQACGWRAKDGRTVEELTDSELWKLPSHVKHPRNPNYVGNT